MSPLPLPAPPRIRRCTPRRSLRTNADVRDTLPKARIVDWSALETRLIRIGDGGMGCDDRHIRAWLICPENADGPDADPARIPAAQWTIATPGRGESALSRDAKTLLVCFDAAWPDGESLFHETASRSFSAEPYPQMEAAAVALLCFVKNHLPDPVATLPDSVTDLHVYTGLKHRLDAWLEAFVAAMIAEGAAPTRLGIADPRIRRAVRLLDAWPLGVPLDRERIAREAGITVPHLARLFNAQLQRTPSRYFDSRRIAHARRSLCQPDLTIKAIASELGFHSEAHFSHWFKQHEHSCPRSFRQAHAERIEPKNGKRISHAKAQRGGGSARKPGEILLTRRVNHFGAA